MHRALLKQREDRVSNVASPATSPASSNALAAASLLASSSMVGAVTVMVVREGLVGTGVAVISVSRSSV
ncbi:MAG TPA: hypothetical protein VG246_02590 [Acidimicrobiales bacterium]|nr:hypothetical protein [Acidimicrobiales bacterium]